MVIKRNHGSQILNIVRKTKEMRSSILAFYSERRSQVMDAPSGRKLANITTRFIYRIAFAFTVFMLYIFTLLSAAVNSLTPYKCCQSTD